RIGSSATLGKHATKTFPSPREERVGRGIKGEGFLSLTAPHLPPWITVCPRRTKDASLGPAASSKTCVKTHSTADSTEANIALMDPRIAPPCRLDITPKWVVIQTCIITGSSSAR